MLRRYVEVHAETVFAETFASSCRKLDPRMTAILFLLLGSIATAKLFSHLETSPDAAEIYLPPPHSTIFNLVCLEIKTAENNIYLSSPFSAASSGISMPKPQIRECQALRIKRGTKNINHRAFLVSRLAAADATPESRAAAVNGGTASCAAPAGPCCVQIIKHVYVF